MSIEICVQGIASAVAAQDGGADRVELCEDLAFGGVTPSAGTIRFVCQRLTIPVHVLIRPRWHDFGFAGSLLDVMRYDIDTAKSLGASGVVFGVLRADRGVDRERTAYLIEAARPLSVTFHRAFDETRDPFAALEELIELGVDRILTSGGEPRAVDALDALGALNRWAAGRIAIMAGGRVSEDDIPKLTAAGLTEIHIGSAACSGDRTGADKVRGLVAAFWANT